jgi:hypothetical protein
LVTTVETRKTQFESTLRSSYEKASIIPDVVGTRWYVENVDWSKRFEKLELRIPTKTEWFSDPQISADMVFYEAGRSLAIREEGYLISQLTSSGETYEPKEEEQFEIIFTVADMLRLRGFRPQVLFLPVDHYSEFFEWSMNKGLHIEFGAKSDTLILDSITRLSLHWSNKFSPFDQAMILDPAFADWIAKPGDRRGSRLKVSLDPGKELVLEVSFHFDKMKPDALIRWHFPNKEKMIPRLQDFLESFRVLENKVSVLLSARKDVQFNADPGTLAKRLGLLDRNMGQRMMSLVGLRNRAVHDPTHVRITEVKHGLAEIGEILEDLDKRNYLVGARKNETDSF